MFETDSPLKRPNNYFNLYFYHFTHYLDSVFHNVDYFCLVLNIKVMSNSKKVLFLDSVVEQLAIYCPQMSSEVMYFVACQFALESNFGESRLAKLKNNYCGMKVPQSRLTLCKTITGDFAKFDSFVDCIIDYVYWLAWNHFNCQHVFNLNLFTRLLISCNYCPDFDYIDRVYTLYNSFKSNFKI